MRLPRPVTVQEFFEEFVADRAPLGVDKYHGALTHVLLIRFIV